MKPSAIFWPVLAQVTLTLIIYARLGYVRGKARKKREVDVKTAALDKSAWPDYALKTSNSLISQFEAPTLFYVLCFMLWALGAVEPFSVGVAWFFVACRVAHASVHMSSNYVPRRFIMFFLSVLSVGVLLGKVGWVLFSNH